MISTNYFRRVLRRQKHLKGSVRAVFSLRSKTCWIGSSRLIPRPWSNLYLLTLKANGDCQVQLEIEGNRFFIEARVVAYLPCGDTCGEETRFREGDRSHVAYNELIS
jgi:hypothetical protein